MSRIMNRRERKSTIGISVVLSVTLLVLSTSPLSAQGSVYAEGAGSWTVSTIANGGWHCGNTGTILAKTNFSTASCLGGPNFPGFNGLGEFESFFLTDATARAFKGSLGAESSVSWFIDKKDSFSGATFNATDATGIATARWDDRARFTVAGPINRPLTFMDITFRVNGSINGAAGLTYPDPNTGASVWVGSSTGMVAFAGGTLGSSFFSSQVVRLGQLPQNMLNIPQFETLRVGVAGLVSNPFNVLLSTQALVNITQQFFERATMTGSMNSQFNHTVTPVSYVLFDDEGTDVTSAYSLNFDQGLEFEAQQSVVPEPATVGLMAIGLCGMFAVRRRSRRKLPG